MNVTEQEKQEQDKFLTALHCSSIFALPVGAVRYGVVWYGAV